MTTPSPGSTRRWRCVTSESRIRSPYGVSVHWKVSESVGRPDLNVTCPLSPGAATETNFSPHCSATRPSPRSTTLNCATAPLASGSPAGARDSKLHMFLPVYQRPHAAMTLHCSPLSWVLRSDPENSVPKVVAHCVREEGHTVYLLHTKRARYILQHRKTRHPKVAREYLPGQTCHDRSSFAAEMQGRSTCRNERFGPGLINSMI